MAEETKEAPRVQAAGFTTLGMGDRVVVQQDDGSWKPGSIVDCRDVYTIMYEDGRHGTTDNKAFTIQRISPAGKVVAGMEVTVKKDEGISVLPGIVAGVSGGIARVVLGSQGTQWQWTRSGEGVRTLHADGSTAYLQILDDASVRNVAVADITCGLSWLKLQGATIEHIGVHPSVLFEPAHGDNPSAAPTSYSTMRWCVPASQGQPANFRPVMSGEGILTAAATMFDIDGDGGLSAAEFNAFQNAAFGLSAQRDQDPDGKAEDEAAKAAVEPDDLRGLALTAGFHIQKGAPLPLGAIPNIWKNACIARARKQGGKTTPASRIQWELANMLVIRLGRGMKREALVTVFDGKPEKTPADKISKFLQSLPKLYLASQQHKAKVGAVAALALAKAAIFAANHPPMKLINSLKGVIKEAIIKAPQVLMVFMEALTDAWNAAPELLGALRTEVLAILVEVKEFLQEAGLVAHAALAQGMELGSQLAAAAAEAAKHGAALGEQFLMQARALFTSGAAAKFVEGKAEELGEMMGDTGTQLAAAIRAGIKEMKQYCNRDTLKALYKSAMGSGESGGGGDGWLTTICTDIKDTTKEVLEELGEIEIDREAILALAKEAAAAGQAAAATAAVMGKAAAQEAAAFASANIPKAIAASQRALADMEKLLNVGIAKGIVISGEVKDAILATIRTGVDEIGPVLAEAQAVMKHLVLKVAPALLASCLASLKELADMLPSLAQLKTMLDTAIADGAAALTLLTNPEAVAALGGVGQAGLVVAASVSNALTKAAAEGAELADVAKTQVIAMAADAAAATRVAAAEAQAFAAMAAANYAAAAEGLPEFSEQAAQRAAQVAASLAADARSIAANTKVLGLEAIAACDGMTGGAASEAVESAARALGEARLVAASLAAEAAEARALAAACIASGRETAEQWATQGAAAAREAAVLAAAAGQEVAAMVAEAAREARPIAAEVAAEAAEKARELAAATAAAAQEAYEAAEPAAREAAAAAVALAKEARERVPVGAQAAAAMALAGARAATAAAAIGAAAMSDAVKSAMAAAIDAIPDDLVQTVQAVLATAVNLGAAVFNELAEVAKEVYAACIEAGRALAPLVPIVVSGAGVAAAAAAVVAEAAAGALADAAGNLVANAAPAAEAALGALADAGSAIGDAAGTAGSYLAGGATAAVGAMAPLVDNAGELAGDAMEVAGSFFDSGLAMGKDFVQWANIDDAYAMTQDALSQVSTAALAAAGGCWACCQSGLCGCDLIKFDIVRDFFQMIGLFFANMATKSMAFARETWGMLSNLIAIDFSFVMPSISPIVIYVFIGIVAFVLLVLFAVFMCMASGRQPDEIREGHEVMSWAEQAEKRKKTVTFMKLFLTACLSVYLPVSRSVFQILMCEATMGRALQSLGINLGCTAITQEFSKTQTYECKCADWAPYMWFQIGAGALLVFFTLALPLRVYYLIKQNIPVGSREDPNSRYDEDGNKVKYTDQMYNQDLMSDPRQMKCPYLFLYKGYERRWAYYKVVVLVIKFLLCIPVIIWWNNVLIQTAATLLLLAVYCAFSFYSSPFINPHADKMDASARLTAAGVVAFALLSAPELGAFADNTGNFWGICIHIINAINVVIMIVFTLAGFPWCRRKIQNTVGRFVFKDTSLNITGSAASIVPRWDVEREVKHRVWHAFWQSIIYNTCSEEVQNRFAELQNRVADVGKHRVKAHFDALRTNANRAAQRMWVQQNLEGVDVYFDGESHDGHLDSATKFGKMYIHPFPFECVMVYDDCDDYTFIHEDKFDQFVAQNNSPDVKQRKHHRWNIRALNGQLCHLEHHRVESHSVPDGQETYTDSEGNTKTRQRYTTVQVDMYYHNGTMSVSANSSKPFAAGFKASLHYSDGHGVAVAPHTGQHHNITNSYTMPMSEFGVNSDFRMTPRLQELFSNNNAKIQAGLPGYMQSCAEYRRGLIEQRVATEKILGSGFWLFVYDNYKAPREAIDAYFRTQEASDEMKTFPHKHRAGLDFLFGRMKWVLAHPCAALWWVFFDDLWEQNRELTVLKDKKDMFDSRSSDSIAYHPCKRPELEKKVEEAGLRNLSGCRGSKKFFNDTVMDVLYERMNELDKEFQQNREATRKDQV